MTKILVIGHSRHGKDTVADIIAKEFGLVKLDTTRMMFDAAVYPVIGKYYRCKQEAYNDKPNRRTEWFHLVRAYAERHGNDWLAKEMINRGSDLVVGCRSLHEFLAIRDLFDLVVWVVRPGVPGTEEMELNATDADVVVINTSLETLHDEVRRKIPL